MPELTVELTWREWEYLEAMADDEEISPEEVVRRNPQTPAIRSEQGGELRRRRRRLSPFRTSGRATLLNNPRGAAHASKQPWFRCPLETAITTATSPTSRWPMRCIMAKSTIFGHRVRASSAIRRILAIAISP